MEAGASGQCVPRLEPGNENSRYCWFPGLLVCWFPGSCLGTHCLAGSACRGVKQAGSARRVRPPPASKSFLLQPLAARQSTEYTVYMTKHSVISISQTDARPLYLQIIEQVQRRVAVGDLAPGEELPSIRQLAAELQVSVITVKRAYLELERDGIIATRQGKGSFVVDNPKIQPTVQIRELDSHLKQAASLGLLLGLSSTEMQKRLGAEIKRALGEK